MKGVEERQMKLQVTIQRLLRLAGPVLSVRYYWAARRDENGGFPFTAATEWRKAAELSSCFTLLAERYWREWERIMQVPRRLAEPIGIAPATMVVVRKQSSAMRSERLQPQAALQQTA